jgi:hypothetical protein
MLVPQIALEVQRNTECLPAAPKILSKVVAPLSAAERGPDVGEASASFDFGYFGSGHRQPAALLALKGFATLARRGPPRCSTAP